MENVVLSVRVRKDLKRRIMRRAINGRYRSTSDFLRKILEREFK